MFSMRSDLDPRRLCAEKYVTFMSTVSSCDVTTVQQHNTHSTSTSSLSMCSCVILTISCTKIQRKSPQTRSSKLYFGRISDTRCHMRRHFSSFSTTWPSVSRFLHLMGILKWLRLPFCVWRNGCEKTSNPPPLHSLSLKTS